MFTKKDVEQIEKKGLTEEKILEQVENFKKGFPFLKLNKPATLINGILSLSEKDLGIHIKVFEGIERTKLKFVPASGAASRMFKTLFEFVDDDCEVCIDQNPYIKTFFNELSSFAFYNDLAELIKGRGDDINSLLANKEYIKILKALLDDNGLSYGTLPKGVLKFHKEQGEIRTAFEEHLVEGIEYAKDKHGVVKLHFTVSPEHISKFKEIQDSIIEKYQNKFEASFEIEYSVQKSSTDMVSVDLNNNLFRNNDESMLFRPGGHGALLENLNDLNADIIFIKNIV